MSIIEVGSHRVRHGSIMDGISDLMNGEVADFFYCDPPWGQGTIRMFETYNHKNGESAPPVMLNEFLLQLFTLANKHSKDLVFIEYGIKWANDVINAGKASGLNFLGTANCLYKSGSKILPHHVHVFSKHGSLPESYFKMFENIPEADQLVYAMLAHLNPPSGGIVLDPCCGLGATAVATKKLGMRFYGNELTAKRANETVRKLKK